MSDVAVVIPVRNAALYLDAALDSVVSQNHFPAEVVVVDDGSTDDSAERAFNYRDRGPVKVIRNSWHGLGSSRNCGIRETTSPLVAFLDADDLWFGTKLAEQVAHLATNQGTVAVGCRMRYESLSGGRPLGIAGQTVGAADQEKIRAGRLMPFPISSLIARRRALEDVGLFDEDLSSDVPGGVEDIELLSRLATVGFIDSVEQVLGVYRIHPSSLSARHFSSQKMGARYVRARIEARTTGGDLSWQVFSSTYRPTLRQRHGDLVQHLYRQSGQHAASGSWISAGTHLLGAMLLGPNYTLPRFLRQRSKTVR
jgi:glycosyltransferase involved in cell wall biosynthesis